MEKGLFVISPEDNVAVALRELSAGERYEANGKTITLREDIPFGHKAALRDITQGENIVKYGYPIGHAVCCLPAGSHVHIQNLKTNLGGILEYKYNGYEGPKREPPQREAFFDGYLRPDGRAGVRNDVWIIPTVGCVNQTAKLLEEKARQAFGDRVDSICAFTHNMGCSQMGEDAKTTMKLLAGLVNHPNAGGVLVLSLGCENNHLEVFRPYLGEIDENRVKFLVTQESEDEYEAGMELLDQLTAFAAKAKRQPVSAEKLTVGFKCGGSDAFSGITANALCGRFCDRLTSCGGSAILTEVPEMFGAETLLMKRAVDEQVFADTVELINQYKNYFTRYGQTIYENPSPGNKKGGISTLEEKSLGCVQKGGRAPVVGVLGYGEAVCKNGLNLLNGSGNDQVSCTNLTASGAAIICFTTGRGNPFGAPAPTVKVSSNTPLYERKPHWIDFNAGRLLDGQSFEEASESFFQYILDVASGKVQTQNEKNGYREISIFKDGVVL